MSHWTEWDCFTKLVHPVVGRKVCWAKPTEEDKLFYGNGPFIISRVTTQNLVEIKDASTGKVVSEPDGSAAIWNPEWFRYVVE